jgi:hypothetical protein
MDDAPALTDKEERALDAIRRQLDSEFPHPARGVVFAWHVNPEPERAPAALPPARRAGRIARLVGAGGALLLAFAAGGAAGALFTAYYSRDFFGPTPEPPKLPSALTRPLAPLSAPQKAPAPKPRPAAGPVVQPTPPPPPAVAEPAPLPELLAPLPPVSGKAAAVAPPVPEPRKLPPESP